MNEIQEYLKSVKAILSTPSSLDPQNEAMLKEIESYFRGTIPNDVRNYVVNVNQLPDDVFGIFSGYEPFTLSEILNHYSDLGDYSFFSAYSVDQHLQASDDSCLRVFATLESDLDPSPEMKDMSRVLPLFDGGSGFYLCLFKNDHTEIELSVITQDFGISAYAPSLTLHLENIEQGLANGSYPIEDDSILFPMAWYQRKKAVSPEGLSMEEWID